MHVHLVAFMCSTVRLYFLGAVYLYLVTEVIIFNNVEGRENFVARAQTH